MSAAGSHELRCPRCGSPHVQGGQRGFGAGRAVGGGLLLGPIGLLAGFAGSRRVVLSCLSCGAQWQPGAAPQPPRQRARASPLVRWGCLGIALFLALACGLSLLAASASR